MYRLIRSPVASNNAALYWLSGIKTVGVEDERSQDLSRASRAKQHRGMLTRRYAEVERSEVSPRR